MSIALGTGFSNEGAVAESTTRQEKPKGVHPVTGKSVKTLPTVGASVERCGTAVQRHARPLVQGRRIV